MSLSAVNVCLVYTHYFGWLIVGVESLYVLFTPTRKLRLFAISVACVTVCFLPWAYAVLKVAINNGGLTNLYMFNRPGWKGIVQHFATLNGPYFHNMRLVPLQAFVGGELFAYPILLWGRYLIPGIRREQLWKDDGVIFWFLFLFAFLPPVLVWAISGDIPTILLGTAQPDYCSRAVPDSRSCCCQSARSRLG